MTPDQITEIRRKLGLALAASENNFNHTSANYICQALAFLPCENCGGSGVEEFRDIESDGDLTYRPCPCCRKPKSHPCKTCNGTKKKMVNGYWGMICKEIPCPDCEQPLTYISNLL